MQTTWDLSCFYECMDSPAFIKDLHALPQRITAFQAAVSVPAMDETAALHTLCESWETIGKAMERLSLMVELTLSCDAENPQANAAMTPLEHAQVLLAQAQSALCRRIDAVKDLDAVIESDDFLRSRAFALHDLKNAAKHLLPQTMEGPLMRMQLSGGAAFSHLRDKLDATLLVSCRGERLPLSAVRALAYDADAAVRRDAYEAELAGYQAIELPMSACLNSIKAEAQTLAQLRGYDDVLGMTLDASRISRKTLDALWEAVRQALPALRGYLRTKAKLLSHADGLPFYDLFAPLGQESKPCTIEEARTMLLDTFAPFCPEMAEMMRTAFDEGWIDVYPHAGKSGGAFCAGCYEQNISRILTNFTGSMDDISTLAHELGHAFNNQMLAHMPYMLTDIPMPLAETASTFNETLLSAALLERATPKEQLRLLDLRLSDTVQTLADIYSRFLFEDTVCRAQADHALSVAELKQIMLDAQDQAYGDGLAKDVRHPDMWVCKSHYYDTRIHYYNFPYAFGSLFARGLYARYTQEGANFVPVYCRLLAHFGSGSIEDVCKSVGMDVTTSAFWQDAIDSVLCDVSRFEVLAADLH